MIPPSTTMFNDPYEIVNPQGKNRGILVCDHASNYIPPELSDLGLDATHLAEHIAVDIGAAALTRCLASMLDMPAILCNYSRLLIDCNRTPQDPTQIPAMSDGVRIPGNENLSEEAKAARITGIFEPYHAAIAALLETRSQLYPAQKPFLFSIHSMTPALKVVGEHRPWELSVLSHTDRTVAEPLLEYLRTREDHHGFCVGDNEPYNGLSMSGYTTPTHGLQRGIPHVLIEVRNDQLLQQSSSNHICNLLANGFQHVIDTLG
eukprot:m.107699 g.107699  ORF g.107699 m.107699 type:complete len:262 (+) comp15196_c0_seq1:1358-2143(+)